MKRNQKRDHNINIPVTKELHDEFKRVCKDNCYSIAKAGRMGIRVFMGLPHEERMRYRK
jgi:hypothetical protein